MKKATLKKMVHNWSWWDAPLLLLVLLAGGFIGGVLVLYIANNTWEAVHLLTEWKIEIICSMMITFLTGRIIAVARWPRQPPLKYEKLTWPGMIAANLITLIMGAMLIITTLAFVAPGVLELLAKYSGG